MQANFPLSLDKVLDHEGGLVNHPKDPGGWTNKGVTIGTLKRLGIDVDGDGDSDLADLKSLRRQDLELVYGTFYWHADRCDLLPAGLDYAVFDFAVNSGVTRAVQHLQRIVGVDADGDIGPKTVGALDGMSSESLIQALCDSRLRFMRQAKNSKTGEMLWPDFGNGWQRRVDEVRAMALKLARAPTAPVSKPKPVWIGTSTAAPQKVQPKTSGFAALIDIIFKLFTKGR